MIRVPLLSPDDVSPEHREFVAALDAGGGFINLYRAMAHSPEGLRRLIDFASTLWGGSLSPRVQEIAVLAVVSASDAPYPLGWHIGDAQSAGLTDAEVRAIVGSEDAVMPPADAAIARFARELALNAHVGDDTYAIVAESLSEPQIVELSLLIGFYRLVSCVANALQVDLDDVPARTLGEFRAAAGE